MQTCKYANVTGCVDCDSPFYNQCKKFRQVHARFLMKKLLKTKEDAFKYTPIKGTEKHNVLQTRKVDVAKSVALQFAIEKNSEVEPITSNVAMDMVCNHSDEITMQVVYLYVTKAVGDSSAIIGMIESFVDIATHNGGKVVICIDKGCNYNFKYKTIQQ